LADRERTSDVWSRILDAEFNSSLGKTRLDHIESVRLQDLERIAQRLRPRSIASSMIVVWLQTLVLLQREPVMLLLFVVHPINPL
jgi:hypothetical protein